VAQRKPLKCTFLVRFACPFQQRIYGSHATIFAVSVRLDVLDARRYLFRCMTGGFVAIEHRGFRVDVNVVPDELGVQWMCRAVIERIDGDNTKGVPPSPELAIPRVKIDPLMAMSSLEHRAVALIDDFYEQGHATQ
jgi:hypothetical protein